MLFRKIEKPIRDYLENQENKILSSSLSRFVTTEEYGIKEGIVLSNSGEIRRKGKIRYLPIYMSAFIGSHEPDQEIEW